MSGNYTLKNITSESERLTTQAKLLYGGSAFLDKFILGDKISVLDVGCGTGVMSKYVAQKNINGTVIGVDIDEKRVKENNEANTYSNLTFQAADAYKLPFADNTFDLCFCRFMLMHLCDPIRAIKEMARVTKKGGTVLAHEGFHDAIWMVPARPVFEKFLSVWKTKMNSSKQDHSIGIRLHTLFSNSNLFSVEHSILAHSFAGSDPTIKQYLNNWREHIPSLKESLSPDISDEDIDQISRELEVCSASDFCLELTVVASGKK